MLSKEPSAKQQESAANAKQNGRPLFPAEAHSEPHKTATVSEQTGEKSRALTGAKAYFSTDEQPPIPAGGQAVTQNGMQTSTPKNATVPVQTGGESGTLTGAKAYFSTDEQPPIPAGGPVFASIYEMVSRIPEGRVATYGQIAAMAGNPRWSRVVGYALHGNPKPGLIPCHRVVNREGRVSSAFAFGGQNAQIERLRAEGVTVSEDGVVDLRVFRWLTGTDGRSTPFDLK